MVLKKSLLAAAAVATIGLGGSALAANLASAQNSDEIEIQSSGPSSLIDKIATKFNLNRDEVQAVFDEERKAHEAEHRTKLEEKLTAAVSEGKLTEDQKSKILEKFDELNSQREENREAFQDLTPEERRAAKEQKRDELRQWAEENNIPEEYLRFTGPGFKHGPRPF